MISASGKSGISVYRAQRYVASPITMTGSGKKGIGIGNADKSNGIPAITMQVTSVALIFL